MGVRLQSELLAGGRKRLRRTGGTLLVGIELASEIAGLRGKLIGYGAGRSHGRLGCAVPAPSRLGFVGQPGLIGFHLAAPHAQQ